MWLQGSRPNVADEHSDDLSNARRRGKDEGLNIELVRQDAEMARSAEITGEQIVKVDAEFVAHIFGPKIEDAVGPKIEDAVETNFDAVQLARQHVFGREALLRGRAVEFRANT